ncbi:MAG: HPr family phosphocarrier protein [Eubacteriales bacterium]|nr:HPr family phosphocarrier protein [Eubacteriales bacterium]
MYSKEITICNPTGLHARPASMLVSNASKYESTITLKRVGTEDEYNVKSIVMLLACGLSQGEKAVLAAEGSDEEQAVTELAAFIENLSE